jgi:putative SOS response-associated peptidase YedK
LVRHRSEYEVGWEGPSTGEIVKRLERGYNMAPGAFMRVVIETPQGREAPSFYWGLRKPFAPPGTPEPSNARGERLLEPLYVNLVRQSRCLVPANGYYEWRQEGGKKIPYFIRTTDQDMYAFAGLYRGSSFCLITTTPAESIAHIHDRMPVILRREDEALWLDRSMRDAEAIVELVRPYPSELLTSWAVGDQVNNPRNNGPDLIKPRNEVQMALGL